jgi:hypothetical protein
VSQLFPRNCLPQIVLPQIVLPQIVLPQIVLPQIIAVALLSATVAAAAGTVCLLPAATAPFSNAGCHHGRAPANPHPVDYRCCLGRHASAIITNAFSPQPTPRAQDAFRAGIVAASSDAGPVVRFTSSSSPPVYLILRI